MFSSGFSSRFRGFVQGFIYGWLGLSPGYRGFSLGISLWLVGDLVQGLEGSRFH